MYKYVTYQAHIKSLEKKVKVACKKVTDMKKKLSKVLKVFKEVEKEIGCLWALLQERYRVHATEKVKFVEES